MSIIDRLQNIDRKVLYLLLIILTAVPLFIKGTVVPTLTNPETQDLYVALKKLPEGSTVVLQSDWTVSSRGESQGQLEAILRILHARKAKIVTFSGADPQAPQVARNVVQVLNKELPDGGFKRWEQWVDLGFYPGLETFAVTMKTDLRKAWGNVSIVDPSDQKSKVVWESPVLKDIKSLNDLSMYINISASGTLKILVQRFGAEFTSKKLAAAVTGVMGPEATNYYASKQIVGLSVGLRGIVELETMMAKGINHSKDGKEPFVKVDRLNMTIDPITEDKYYRGMNYFISLHVAMTMLIVAVILGNLGVIRDKIRRRGAK